MTPSILTPAYLAGVDAYRDGIFRDACPYADPVQRQMWLNGWDAAKAEAKGAGHA